MEEELCRYINRVDRQDISDFRGNAKQRRCLSTHKIDIRISPQIHQSFDKATIISIEWTVVFHSRKTLHIAAAALSRVKLPFEKQNREILTIASQRRTSHQLEEPDCEQVLFRRGRGNLILRIASMFVTK